jgi:hypothetical protein
MIFGQWRVRPRWHWRNSSGLWVGRTQFPEGTVYRAALGLVQITVMVDCQTDAQRQAAAKRILEWLNG